MKHHRKLRGFPGSRSTPAGPIPRTLCLASALLVSTFVPRGASAAAVGRHTGAALNVSQLGLELEQLWRGALVGKQEQTAVAAKPKVKKLRGMYGGGDIVENDAAPMGARDASCNEAFPAPELRATVCPSACPFMRYDSDKICHWKCITEDLCLNSPNQPLGVANKKTGMCVLCAVVGCHRCGETEHVCLACKDGFDMLDGTCRPNTRHYWRVLYAVIFAVVLLVAVWLLLLKFRQPVNRAVLEEALLHRSLSKVRCEEDGHKLYPLHTDLCNEVIPSGGVGIMLHFRFERMTLLWSVFVAAVMGSVAWFYSHAEAGELFSMAPAHDEALEVCSRLDTDDQAELEDMRQGFLIATGIVYVSSALGALAFSIWQRRHHAKVDEQTSTMEDFALCCDGFPVEAWGSTLEAQPGAESLEDQYTKFFRAVWGDGVLGVSIVWDTDEIAEEVEDLSQVTSARMEVSRGHAQTRALALQGIKPRGVERDSEDYHGTQVSHTTTLAHGVTHAPKRLCHIDLDGLLLGQSPLGDFGAGMLHREHTKEELELLLNLKTTGSVFVVFNTWKERERASHIPPGKFRGESDIRIEKLECDAATVLWDGFATSFNTRLLLAFKGIMWLLLVMVLWAVCFYGPYAYYVISWNQVQGASQGMQDWTGFIQNTVLGLVITVGNLVVYSVCNSTAEQCKFTSRDARDSMSVVLYTFAVTLNTILDLALVARMAHGWQQDTGLDEEALIRNPSMQHALFTQLVGYIYPGTILMPFLIEPLATVTIPYYLFMWLIRSRREVDRVHAEELMVCPPFDLNRYGDIIINMSLCSLIFFLTSVNIWWMFAQLVTSGVVIYVWDHYKYIRESQRTMFATSKMDICGQYLLVLPCSILAGAFAFKYQGGQAMVRGWDRHHFFALRTEWLIVIAAVLIHGAVHLLVLRFLVPLCVQDTEDETKTYAEVAKSIACNWFNANPGHCLRSCYHFVHEPPHILDAPGKAHLHRVNPAIHSYYEAPDFEEEHSLFAEAMGEVTKSLDYVKHEACLGFAHLKSSVESMVGSRSPSSVQAESPESPSSEKNTHGGQTQP